MQIEEKQLISYLTKIVKLHDELDDTRKELEASKEDAIAWWKRWKILKDKYEKEEEENDSGETAENTTGA